jgi:hypothetical protein
MLTVGLPHVCINIGEQWPLYQPGTYWWGKADDPQGINDNTVAQQYAVLSEFRQWNPDSKLSWWNLPMHLPGYDLQKKYPQYGWRGPEAQPYSGHVQLMMWQAAQLRGLVDYGMTSAYWPEAREPQFDMPMWRQIVLHGKMIAECGYNVPAGFSIMPKKDHSPELHYFAPGVLRQMFNFMATVLSADDVVVWWEGNQAAELNAQLANYDEHDDWIDTFSSWMT